MQQLKDEVTRSPSITHLSSILIAKLFNEEIKKTTKHKCQIKYFFEKNTNLHYCRNLMYSELTHSCKLNQMNPFEDYLNILQLMNNKTINNKIYCNHYNKKNQIQN